MRPKVIAEVGCNHQGSIKTAFELIDRAADAGVDYIKFQKRDNEFLSRHFDWDKPHPNEHNSFGRTYKEHREALELSIDQHRQLQNYCNEHGVGYSTSVWDINSAMMVVNKLKPDFIKVPSAMNTHYDLIQTIYERYKGGVHISLGMTTQDEIDQILKLVRKYDPSQERTVLYHCTSGYPVPFDELYLQEIRLLSHKGYTTGYSGHHLGIAVDIAAYTLGAEWIERHFTLDRTMKGTDHSASLEPRGLYKLVRDLGAAHEALSLKQSDISDIEVEQRRKLKWR